MRRWLFNIVAGASLVLCVAFAGLWARSINHFERVDLRYARWTRADEVNSWFAGFSWYSNTLRLEVIRLPFSPGHFRGRSDEWMTWFRKDHPPGARWAFLGEEVTGEMNGYPPGFEARHNPFRTAGVAGDAWVVAVRPWAPTLATAVLPGVWVWRFWRARRARRRRGGLRELRVRPAGDAAVVSGVRGAESC